MAGLKRAAGCWCGKPGEETKVTRTSTTRRYFVTVTHPDSGVVHENVMGFDLDGKPLKKEE